MPHPPHLVVALFCGGLASAALCACDQDPPATQASLGDASDTGEVASTPDAIARKRCELPPDSAVSLPADDSRHAAPMEWFYWTGHLQSEDGRWFGFHITVLVAGPVGYGFVLAHHSLTRADAPLFGGRYSHGFELGLEKSDLPSEGFRFDMGDLAVSGYDGNDRLRSKLAGGHNDSELTLTLSDPRGPVVRHGNGFQDYGGGITTYYYARPRQTASGTLRVDGEELAVTGTVWFDHQWGTLAAPDKSRWDWIAMQLDDGRDLMVVQLPTPDGALFSFAELTDSACNITHFHGDEVSFTGRKTWQSPESGCVYPMGWDVTVGDLSFALAPLADDQEMQAEPIPYWEGAATVTGSATGRAYVELVGYCL